MKRVCIEASNTSVFWCRKEPMLGKQYCTPKPSLKLKVDKIMKVVFDCGGENRFLAEPYIYEPQCQPKSHGLGYIEY